MKKQWSFGVAVLGLAAAMSAHAAGFADAWAPATWTTSFAGTVASAANGGVDTSGAPASVTLNGGNDPTDVIGCIDGNYLCQVQFTHVTPGNLPISFHWSYVSSDSAGAQLDSFGVLLAGGTQVPISNPGGAASQQGDYSFTPPAGTMGFYMNCGDCTGGNAVVTISALAVPEPGSMALMGFGLLGVTAWRRRAAAR